VQSFFSVYLPAHLLQVTSVLLFRECVYVAATGIASVFDWACLHMLPTYELKMNHNSVHHFLQDIVTAKGQFCEIFKYHQKFHPNATF